MAREQIVDIESELVANVMAVSVSVGDRVTAGDAVALLESMKMEIPVLTDASGEVIAVRVDAGDVVQEGTVLLSIRVN